MHIGRSECGIGHMTFNCVCLSVAVHVNVLHMLVLDVYM